MSSASPALAEFISTLIFVFAGEGSGMAYNKLTGNAPSSPPGLVAAAVAHGFGLFVAVSVSANISGGHVNPAVTFGLFLGGNVSLFRGILYIIAQLLGSVVACLLLLFSTGGLFFFYEHMPIIPRTLYDFDIHREDFEDSELFLTFSLMVGWSQSVERESRNCYNKKNREEFHLMLTNENIVWQPYARLRDDFLPYYLVGQMDVALACTLLICFEKLAYHRMNLCPLKLNLPADLISIEPSLTRSALLHKKLTGL